MRLCEAMTMSAIGRAAQFSLGVVLALTLSACGGGEGGNSCTSGSTNATVHGSNGTLSLDTNNASACGKDEVNAAVDKVQVQ